VWFLNHSMNRKRNPIKPQQFSLWQNCANKWLKPEPWRHSPCKCEQRDRQDVGCEDARSETVAQDHYKLRWFVKLVVGSALDKNGEQLFPRKWNHEFMDLPVVEDQHQPTFTSETMSAIAQKADWQERVLYACSQGTGLRIGEALGLEVKHLSSDCRTIIVEHPVGKVTSRRPRPRTLTDKLTSARN